MKLPVYFRQILQTQHIYEMLYCCTVVDLQLSSIQSNSQDLNHLEYLQQQNRANLNIFLVFLCL